MNWVDFEIAIKLIKNVAIAKQQLIFDIFGVDVPDGHVLLLPKKYSDVIGDGFDKITYSSHINESVMYIIDKKIMCSNYECMPTSII